MTAKPPRTQRLKPRLVISGCPQCRLLEAEIERLEAQVARLKRKTTTVKAARAYRGDVVPEVDRSSDREVPPWDMGWRDRL